MEQEIKLTEILFPHKSPVEICQSLLGLQDWLTCEYLMADLPFFCWFFSSLFFPTSYGQNCHRPHTVKELSGECRLLWNWRKNLRRQRKLVKRIRQLCHVCNFAYVLGVGFSVLFVLQLCGFFSFAQSGFLFSGGVWGFFVCFFWTEMKVSQPVCYLLRYVQQIQTGSPHGVPGLQKLANGS